MLIAVLLSQVLISGPIPKGTNVVSDDVTPLVRAEQICEKHLLSRPPEEHWLSHWDTFEPGWEQCNKIAQMADDMEAEVNRTIDAQRREQDNRDHAYVSNVAAGKLK